ncbi:MAG: thioredoxin domain-containing protein, partial [Pseudomonadota bacterium]
MKSIIKILLITVAMPVAAEDGNFGERVRFYLLSNPEVILEVFAVLEAQEAEMETASNAALVSDNQAALFQSDAPFAGKAEASRVLVKFVDYRCGYCRLVHSTVEEAKAADPGLKFIYKMFPILGPDSTLMAQMALAIYHELGQGAFLKAQDVFFAYQGPVS